MNNGWTKERKERQAKLIRQWKPWKLAGVKTEEGKAIGKMNAYKHGGHTKFTRRISRFITECKLSLKNLKDSN